MSRFLGQFIHYYVSSKRLKKLRLIIQSQSAIASHLGIIILAGFSALLINMELPDVIGSLKSLAPLEFAESWDNVGLLVQPNGQHTITKLLLTNDLTEDVLEEAIQQHAELILSYHPPIFAAIKRLTTTNWKERCILGCVERRIAVYSPHTSWDAVDGGVNDWLAKAFGSNVVVQPLSASLSQVYSHKVCLNITADTLAFATNASLVENLTNWISRCPDIEWHKSTSQEVDLNQARSGGYCLKFRCKHHHLEHLSNLISGSSLLQNLEITKLEKMPLPTTGMGRMCSLDHPLSLDRTVQIIKNYLHLPYVRVAIGRGRTMNETTIKEIALCAGSGSSVLRNVSADLYWTGEMSHHDVLDAIHKGTSVILCEHSNTERGFLKHVAPKLREILEGKVEIVIAEKDIEALQIQ